MGPADASPLDDSAGELALPGLADDGTGQSPARPPGEATELAQRMHEAEFLTCSWWMAWWPWVLE